MRLLFTSLFFVFYFSINSQTILVTPADTTVSVSNADLSDNWITFSPRVSITNTTADTLHIIWRREILTECPMGWDFFVSDLWNDYVPHVTTNYDPSISLNGVFPILPNQTMEALTSHLYPRTEAGCCEVAFHISELNNPDSILATAFFEYRINDLDCSIVNDVEVVQNKISIFPNPTSDKVFIETEDVIQSVQGFNLIGEKIKGFNFVNGQLDISGLAQGVFILKITLSNGKEIIRKIEKI